MDVIWYLSDTSGDHELLPGKQSRETILCPSSWAMSDTCCRNDRSRIEWHTSWLQTLRSFIKKKAYIKIEKIIQNPEPEWERNSDQFAIWTSIWNTLTTRSGSGKCLERRSIECKEDKEIAIWALSVLLGTPKERERFCFHHSLYRPVSVKYIICMQIRTRPYSVRIKATKSFSTIGDQS